LGDLVQKRAQAIRREQVIDNHLGACLSQEASGSCANPLGGAGNYGNFFG
jgi:hypothetical protein